MTAPVEFLDLLDRDDREELMSLSRRVRAARGDVLLRQGDDAGVVLILIAGWAKVVLLAKGVETLLAVRGPGSLLGEQGLVEGRTRSASAIAMEPVDLMSIPAPPFRTFLAQRPEVTLTMLAVMSARLRDSDARLAEFAAADTLGRVSARLVELAEAHATTTQEGALQIDLALTQQELADWTGASLESTARALRTLRQLGRIRTARRLIEVCDLPGLRAHAPGPPV